MRTTVHPFNAQRIASFLHARLAPDVLARLEVGYDMVALSKQALGGEADTDGIIRPIPPELFRPPRELLVIPAGLNRSNIKGDYLFDEVSAALVRDEAVDWGNDYSSDYEHAAFHPLNIAAPASSWYRVEVRDTGLWAVDIRWLEQAAEHLRKQEYRYWSPAFARDRETGRVVLYFNFGLTNIPATHNQVPILDQINSALAELSASARRPVIAVPAPAAEVVATSATAPTPPAQESRKMKYALLLSLLNLSSTGDDAKDEALLSQHITGFNTFRTSVTTALELAPSATAEQTLAEIRSLTGMRNSVTTQFNLPRSAGPEKVEASIKDLRSNAAQLDQNVDRLAGVQAELLSITGHSKPEETPKALESIKQLATEVATLTGKAKLPDQIATLHAHKDAAAEVATLSGRVQTLEAENAELKGNNAQSERDRIIDAAVASGQLAPALKEKALSMHSKFGKDGLETYIASLPAHPAAKPPAQPTPAAQSGGGAAPGGVSASLVKLGSKAGLSPDKLALAQKQHYESLERNRNLRERAGETGEPGRVTAAT